MFAARLGVDTCGYVGRVKRR